MTQHFKSDKPIFLQIREKIEDQIVQGTLKEGEQAPSTTQLVNFYKVNHVTVAKGINQLVEAEILFKRRGIGTFVTEGAQQKLLQKRKETFASVDLRNMIIEAEKLNLSEEELINLIKKTKEELHNES
ncbi:GntR family transcriptional regulator [Virgibacillus halodenitrificans]|jgi:GntR family transcriptional regulator|uniref:GntR family transcriptional regulator n=1 Tax=Virgibacillus halodenitrificans TaxID=1482 RepID=A0AAC9NK35_VIRHA|nr:GntR family transcriptional regulator [Virgibacillus halodenitrificans]APC47633.1 GntR family transcriptional regulator [Virgibacillus halodenitrificans]MCJ0930447.1 GntR family transcriptional regulator [Virgibacillus halodenitrificans]